VIDPVFVGLVVAGFVFLYAELSRVVRWGVERGEKKEAVEEAIELRDKEVYDGEEGIAEFVGFYIESLGLMYSWLTFPLIFYLVSIVVLLVGYGWDISWAVNVGVGLLVFAVLVVGVLSSIVYVGTVVASRKKGRMITGVLMDVIRKVRKGGEGGDIGVGG
jgi:hypothetical protein